MDKAIRVSVALAAYNGEKYIKEQLESVLASIGDEDEIVVSDDGSADSTREVVVSLNDPRIVLVKGPGKGIKKNFENAIEHCCGKYIFLCDQDDIWEKEKVERVLETFDRTKCTVVVHDCSVIGNDGKVIYPSYFGFRKSGRGALKNIFKNTYIGCCMAFDAEKLKNKVLPIPQNIVMHDQWIGVLSDIYGSSVFTVDNLMKYRRHGGNSSEISVHFGPMTMLKNRLIFIREIFKRKKQIRIYNKI